MFVNTLVYTSFLTRVDRLYRRDANDELLLATDADNMPSFDMVGVLL